jgi:hypothetical protein
MNHYVSLSLTNRKSSPPACFELPPHCTKDICTLQEIVIFPVGFESRSLALKGNSDRKSENRGPIRVFAPKGLE